MDVADPGQGLGSILRRMLRAVRSIGALRFLVLAWGSLRNSLKVFGASVCRQCLPCCCNVLPGCFSGVFGRGEGRVFVVICMPRDQLSKASAGLST